MSSGIQILSLLVSFGYGMVFYLVSRFNRFIVAKKRVFVQLVFSTILVIDLVILYIFMMYKINSGNIHPYFVGMVVLGYILMYFKYKKCKDCVKRRKLHN